MDSVKKEDKRPFVRKKNEKSAPKEQDAGEKEAIAQSYELSSLLLEIERLKLEKEKSEVLIRYLLSKKTE